VACSKPKYHQSKTTDDWPLKGNDFLFECITDDSPSAESNSEHVENGNSRVNSHTLKTRYIDILNLYKINDLNSNKAAMSESIRESAGFYTTEEIYTK